LKKKSTPFFVALEAGDTRFKELEARIDVIEEALRLT
jgi:hypothetical protein